MPQIAAYFSENIFQTQSSKKRLPRQNMIAAVSPFRQVTLNCMLFILMILLLYRGKDQNLDSALPSDNV